MKNKDKLWEKVKKDFPRDSALQEVHYARLKIHEETKGMNPDEFVKYIKKRQIMFLNEREFKMILAILESLNNYARHQNQ